MMLQNKKRAILIFVGLVTLLIGVSLSFFLEVKVIGFILMLVGFVLTVWASVFMNLKNTSGQ